MLKEQDFTECFADDQEGRLDLILSHVHYIEAAVREMGLEVAEGLAGALKLELAEQLSSVEIRKEAPSTLH